MPKTSSKKFMGTENVKRANVIQITCLSCNSTFIYGDLSDDPPNPKFCPECGTNFEFVGQVQ